MKVGIFLRSSTDRIYNLLKRAQSPKQILIKDSFLVGLIVSIVIVIHRFMASELGYLFTNIYLQGRANILLIPLIFALLIVLGYIVAKQLKKSQ